MESGRGVGDVRYVSGGFERHQLVGLLFLYHEAFGGLFCLPRLLLVLLQEDLVFGFAHSFLLEGVGGHLRERAVCVADGAQTTRDHIIAADFH